MIQVEDYEAIRRSCFVDDKSIRVINRELGCDPETIRKAITHFLPQPYQLKQPGPALVIGPYKTNIDQLLDWKRAISSAGNSGVRRIAFTNCFRGRVRAVEGGGTLLCLPPAQEAQKKKGHLPAVGIGSGDGRPDGLDGDGSEAGRGARYGAAFPDAAELLQGALCHGLPVPKARSLLRGLQPGVPLLWRDASTDHLW